MLGRKAFFSGYCEEHHLAVIDVLAIIFKLAEGSLERASPRMIDSGVAFYMWWGSLGERAAHKLQTRPCCHLINYHQAS